MKKRSKRVIIDTNLWIRFLISRDYSVIDKLLFQERIQLIFSSELVGEFVEVAQRPKFRRFFPLEELSELVEMIEEVADFVEVTTDDIRLYLAVEREKNQQKAVSIDNIRRILNSFFSFLNEEEYISNNPVKRIKKVKGQKTEKTAFTQLELEKLRMSCKNSLEKAIIEVLISSAVRATELANIKIRDIDFEKNEIRIIRKGNKEGVAFMSTIAALAIKKYISERGNYNTPYLWVVDGFMYKCSKRLQGSKIDTNGFRRILKSIATRAKVENVHPHRFRRTFATMALKKGMDVEEIQQVLGHQNINTTMIYVNIDKSSVKEKYKNIVGG